MTHKKSWHLIVLQLTHEAMSSIGVDTGYEPAITDL